jgi:hypothetical protein
LHEKLLAKSTQLKSTSFKYKKEEQKRKSGKQRTVTKVDLRTTFFNQNYNFTHFHAMSLALFEEFEYNSLKIISFSILEYITSHIEMPLKA